MESRTRKPGQWMQRSAGTAVMLLLASAAMTACGGGDDGNTASGGTNGGASTGATPAQVRPLAGGSLYMGSVSFGDTVSVQLDQPAAGQITLRFLDSRFGLAGALVGQYTQIGDT